MKLLERYPSLPYVVPFAAFMAMLMLGPRLPVEPHVMAIARLAIGGVLVWFFSRQVLSFAMPRWLGSVAVGIGVFALWIAPDVLVPQYRGHWLFSNGLVGKVEAGLAPELRGDLLMLALRSARAVILVPIVEELFWRGWLPRWIDRMEDFRGVPLGQYSRFAFYSTALLFGLEHGPLWDVGIVTGILYNWWMQRTKSLGDCILAHAVTNACLSAYVIGMGRWEYW